MNKNLEYPGFETQNKTYDCGAHSIRHALLALGIPASQDNVIRSAETLGVWGSYMRYGNLANAGTSNQKIVNAIKRFGFDSEEFEESNIEHAKAFLDKWLLKGCPVILSVDNNDHWNTAIGKVGEKYLIADSWDGYKYPDSNKAVAIYSWDDLVSNRWYICCEQCGETIDDNLNPGEKWCNKCKGYCQNDEGKDCKNCGGLGWVNCEKCNKEGYVYYGIAVIPRTKKLQNHSAVTRSEILAKRLVNEQSLQEYWGYYLSDLVDCRQQVPENPEIPMISMSKVINDLKSEFIIQSEYWLAGISKSDVNYELSNYILVAESYDMQFPKSEIDKFILDFTMTFTMTLAEWYVYN